MAAFGHSGSGGADPSGPTPAKTIRLTIPFVCPTIHTVLSSGRGSSGAEGLMGSHAEALVEGDMFLYRQPHRSASAGGGGAARLLTDGHAEEPRDNGQAFGK